MSTNDTYKIKDAMEIRIDPHTLARAEERGTTQEEIIDVIENGVPIKVKRDRSAKAKVFYMKRLEARNSMNKSA